MPQSLPTPTPALPEHFDYPRAAREAKLTDTDLCSLVRLFEIEYPSDLMLRELHILRACNAIIRGSTTIRQILSMPGTQAAA